MLVPRSNLIPHGNIIAGLGNAKLTFKTNNGFSGFDPDSGNPIDVFTTFELTAYLKQVKPSKLEQIPGVNAGTIYLKGRALAPKLLPLAIKPGSTADAVIENVASGNQLKGQFTLTACVQSAHPGVTEEMGTKITGYLQL